MFVLLLSSAILVSCDRNPVSNDSSENGTVTDIDGNVYKTVRIGKQVWTVENLKTTQYNDGTPIPHVTERGVSGGTTGWRNLTTGAYCYYDTNPDYKGKYGALYNWYAVNTGKLAPKGWHVPTDSEWTELEEYLIANGYNWDDSKFKNKIAKALAAKTDWIQSNEIGAPGNDLSRNNASGFSALPGGARSYSGDFNGNISNRGDWWSATAEGESYAYSRYLNSGNEELFGSFFPQSTGFHVRLVKDN